MGVRFPLHAPSELHKVFLNKKVGHLFLLLKTRAKLRFAVKKIEQLFSTVESEVVR